MANVTAVERTEFDPPPPSVVSGEPVSRLAVADALGRLSHADGHG